MFTFKAFRAIDEPEICDQFIEGHANVLKEYGVTKVTSSITTGSITHMSL